MYMLSEARHVNKVAREVYIEEGHHDPIMLIFVEGVEGYKVMNLAPFMATDQGKNLLAGMIRRMAMAQVITGVVTITEAWFADVDSGDENAEKLKSGEVKVGDLESKKEVLMVKAESDDGLDVLFLNEIQRDAGGKPTLLEPREIKGCTGRLGGFFAPVPDNRSN